MALPKLPPAVDIPPDAKRRILAGFRQLLETFQARGKFEPEVTHTDVLHDPDLLASFIATFRANPDLCAELVVGFDGKPVTDPDKPLVCAASLAQIQQLMVKTCARHLFVQDDESKTVTRTVTTTRFLIFKDKTQITERVRSKDPRALREILGRIAFDWQLPLLADYAELSLQQLAELGDNLLALRTAQAVREVQQMDYTLIRKARNQLGPEFTALLETRPAAVRGALYWPKDMYQFFQSAVGRRFYEFLGREEKYFMLVATMEKATMKLFGDILAYIAPENLAELQRLNIDKTDVLLATVRSVFGPKLEPILKTPNFSRQMLRRQVDSLLHMRQEKPDLAEIQMVTWTALAPQVLEWLAKQSQAA